jgi:hypothetical protein
MMKKAFNKTLDAIVDLVEVMESLRTDMTISDSRKKEDLQKIIFLLDDAVKLLIESITVFGKYRDLW